MDHFEEAGLFPALDEMGFEKKLGARFLRGDQVCNFNFSDKFGEGWDWTWQVPRADFDDTLAKAAISKGVDIEFETELTDIKFNGTDSVSTVKNKNGDTKEIHAKFVIDSSGYGRVLPRLLDNVSCWQKYRQHQDRCVFTYRAQRRQAGLFEAI